MSHVPPPGAAPPYVKKRKDKNRLVRYIKGLTAKTFQRAIQFIEDTVDSIPRSSVRRRQTNRNNRKQSKGFSYKLRSSYTQTTTVEYSNKVRKNEGAQNIASVKLTRSSRKHANSVKSKVRLKAHHL